MTTVLRHPILGAICGRTIGEELHRFYSLPYASIPSRFSRSSVLEQLPKQRHPNPYDATEIGPSSIQLAKNAAHDDAKNNQLPTDDVDEQEQDEDCLRLTVTKPSNAGPESKLPVLVFIHGGAFFLGSGERRWLDPTTFCMHGLNIGNPAVFVSVNYRLGLLGFLHSYEAPDILPPNNALHDQIRAFEWISRNIAGFGGDPKNITAMGQSAGGESLSLHNLSGLKQPLYRRAITLSGTLVTMPAKTPEDYQTTFIDCAKKMDIPVDNQTSVQIAQDMVSVNVDKIRAANFVGAPCTFTDVLPYERPTMNLMRSGSQLQVDWLESQLVSSCTYDGSISYIITHNNHERKDHASGFMQIAQEILQYPGELYDIYGIHEADSDEEALAKICLFESDIGFISATISQATGLAHSKTKTYFQLFDLGNPFKGLLPQGEYASHTWDIVALLGAYEDRQTAQYWEIIQKWRKLILEFVTDGSAPCDDFRTTPLRGLLVDKNGVKVVPEQRMPGAARRLRLWQLAWAEKGDDGLDFLWEGLCRRWLDQGE